MEEAKEYRSWCGCHLRTVDCEKKRPHKEKWSTKGRLNGCRSRSRWWESGWRGARPAKSVCCERKIGIDRVWRYWGICDDFRKNDAGVRIEGRSLGVQACPTAYGKGPASLGCPECRRCSTVQASEGSNFKALWHQQRDGQAALQDNTEEGEVYVELAIWLQDLLKKWVADCETVEAVLEFLSCVDSLLTIGDRHWRRKVATTFEKAESTNSLPFAW